jgi:hypothetical protein
MDEETKDINEDVNQDEHLQRPRDPRVPVNFSIDIEGITTTGESFKERAKAIKVSRGGATLITDLKVDVGTKLNVMTPFGRFIEAEVNGVWIDNESGKQHVGVKLLSSEGWFAEHA